MEHRYIETNGVTLHVVEAGPADGAPVVLLHGFPELWWAWREQLAPLAAAGLRLIVPDLRGYNLSDRPARVADYRIDTLAGDVVGLLDALGIERASVVGHDWGGALAWWMGSYHPSRLERLVIFNCAHPHVMARALATRQLLRSWYMFLFQVPGLAERVARGWLLEAGLRTARPGTFSDDDMARYAEAWARPGAVRAMLAWYRASFRELGRLWRRPPRITAPVLLGWGMRDMAFAPLVIGRSAALCDDVEVVRFDDATHWVIHERAAEVTALLERFLIGAA